MKRYKLLEDLPTFNAGDIFELRDDGCLWLVDMSEEGHWKKNVMAYHKHTLEAFPNILMDWFEEISGFWCIRDMGNIEYVTVSREGIIGAYKRIGNYFETREEAERAVERLRAWKRIKDDGLKIREYELHGGTDRNGCFTGDICLTLDITKPVYEDAIQLLFGGEE